MALFWSRKEVIMRHAIKYMVLLAFGSFVSCSYLQKAKDTFQNRPQIEGAGAENISDNTDIDSDTKGSDSGNIDGLSSVYFALDSSELTEDIKETLNANKVWMDSNINVQRIILEGHCDPLGSEAYNIGLGERRAQSVFNYLSSIGLDENKMSIVSYGEEKILSEINNGLNRRVNFVPQY